MTTAITIKLSADILERIPSASNGRSRFIRDAVEEKLSRKQPADWKPASRRGRKMAALLAKGDAERHSLLNESQFENELAKRRGRQF